MSASLLFLGTGAGCGVPAFFCDCVACREASMDPRSRRSCCGLLIQNEMNVLIDTPPDLRSQLVREKINKIDQVVFTHWHYDHIGGLGELEFYQRLKNQNPIPCSLSEETADFINNSFGFMTDCLEFQTLSPMDQFKIDGFTYTALPAQHTPGTYGYLIESRNGKRTAYFPDTGPLLPAVKDRLQNVDNLILDATFWGRNWTPEVHNSLQSAVETALQLSAKKTFFTHLSMHYDQPVTNLELETYLEEFGSHLHLAYDGLRLNL